MTRAVACIMTVLAGIQALLGARLVWRLLSTGGEPPIRVRQTDSAVGSAALAVIVPVLDEEHRLRPCLEGLLAQGPAVGQIFVVDGGSNDHTCALVREFERRDPRVSLLEAGPAPADWNGKVWGLHVGETAASDRFNWILTFDADVRPTAGLAHAMLQRAITRDTAMLSLATSQELGGALDCVLHPALLATLVYRFGRPGTATSEPRQALANGQCCLIRRDALHQLGGFASVRGSLCEDVTLARRIAQAGEVVAFFEADALVSTRMYADYREMWRNWPRSLALRDSVVGRANWIALLEVALLQALPLPSLLTNAFLTRAPRQRSTGASVFVRINLLLLAMRIGMLLGMARAYSSRSWTYWLSPLADSAAAFALWRSALEVRHTWRGRAYVRQNGSLVSA